MSSGSATLEWEAITRSYAASEGCFTLTGIVCQQAARRTQASEQGFHVSRPAAKRSSRYWGTAHPPAVQVQHAPPEQQAAGRTARVAHQLRWRRHQQRHL